MKAAPLVPASFATTSEGTPFSPAFDDVYHSADGGLAQARHVFIAGNNLHERAFAPAGKQHDQPHDHPFVIVETGFGLGINFLATWQAWQAAGKPCRLHFISFEKHPLPQSDLARALAGFAELAPLATQLLKQWPVLVSGFHRLHFDDDKLALTLIFGDAQTQLPKLEARADALYLDGFAPAKNPDLWTPEVLAALTRLCRPASTLATWSVAGGLRRALEQLGWTLTRRPGFGNKREMLSGLYAPPAPAVSPSATAGNAFLARPPCSSAVVSSAPTFSSAQRKAIIIGAGLAGAAISERLAQRGWQVEIFERHPEPAQEASGNPAGVLLPLLTKDDAPAAQLARACYLYTLRRLAALPGVRYSACGVLHIADDLEHEAWQKTTVANLGLAQDFVRFLDLTDAETLTGQTLVHGGLWFPTGGWVDPRSLCKALLSAGGELVRTRYGVTVDRLEQTPDGWQIFDSANNHLASAPHVILANAQAAENLLPYPVPLTLIPIRGQVSFLPDSATSLPTLRHVLCRTGYLTPPASDLAHSFSTVGASFDRHDSNLQSRLEDHVGNLRRLDEILPGRAKNFHAESLAGRVGIRSASRDHLPLAGTLPAQFTARQAAQVTLRTLPRQAGLHALLGLGARGMIWAQLLAEFLASQLCEDPLPLEQPLARLVDPARFYLHAQRRTPNGPNHANGVQENRLLTLEPNL
jgi:tRNA 5-methylaminomethyl-2-thiouridine biosynthesis bifunctional protein